MTPLELAAPHLHNQEAELLSGQKEIAKLFGITL